jgi:RNA polymerase sigma-70 factor (ECF subfamily)
MTATLTFGPDSMGAEHVSSRAGNLKQAAPGVANALTSVELLARARAGDEVALNDLCARYLPRLQKWAHGRLPPYARGALDTHDIVQDTLSQVVQRLGSFEPRHDGAFQAFLRTSLLNRIRDQIRWAQRRPTDALASDRPADGPSPIEEAIGSEALARYETALQRLKPSDREAIIARIELGHPYAEVARALGKPTIAAAHVAVSRALVKLANEMKEISRDKRS